MLILKSASKSRPSGQWRADDYDVFEFDRNIGRIMWTHAAPADCRPPSGMPMLIGMAGRASASRRARTRMRWVTTQKKPRYVSAAVCK